jgi:hypothetical protein
MMVRGGFVGQKLQETMDADYGLTLTFVERTFVERFFTGTTRMRIGGIEGQLLATASRRSRGK